MLYRNRLIGVMLIAAMLVVTVLVAAPAVFAAFAAEVFVIDQPIVDGHVTVTRATINEPGWLVIHADEDGAPGPVIGYAPLPVGISANVDVAVDGPRLLKLSMPCCIPMPGRRAPSSSLTVRTHRSCATTSSSCAPSP